MFYFTNNIDNFRIKIKNVFKIPSKLQEKTISVIVTNPESKNILNKEIDLFFKIKDTSKFSLEKYTFLVEGFRMEEFKVDIVNNDSKPMYRFIIKCRNRSTLTKNVNILIEMMEKDKNIYDIFTVLRLTSSGTRSEYYYETRIYQLIKMFMNTNGEVPGTVELDVNVDGAFEHLEDIVLYSLTHNRCVKIIMDNITLSEKIKISKFLFEEYKKGGIIIKYEDILNIIEDSTQMEIYGPSRSIEFNN